MTRSMGPYIVLRLREVMIMSGKMETYSDAVHSGGLECKPRLVDLNKRGLFLVTAWPYSLGRNLEDLGNRGKCRMNVNVA